MFNAFCTFSESIALSFPETLKMRPLQNGTFCPISASGSNFNPRNIQYIPVVEPDLKFGRLP
jgi:hypothetical protein